MRRLMAVAALCAAAAACSDITGGPTNALSDGRTQVLLTDAPFPYHDIAEVNVYVARIDVSANADTTGGSQDWVTVATPQRAFNLLDLQGGTTALLGEADLPAAQYAAVRMVINTSRSSIVRTTGALANVQWPVADELTLHALVEQPLFVGSGGAQIVIDFDVGRSFIEDGNGGFIFLPVIRAVNAAATGAIRGSVTISTPSLILWSLENLPIEVYRVDPQSLSPLGYLAATGRTDGQGRYVIPYLLSGTYRVTAYVPGYNYLGSGQLDVTAGGTATMNLVIGSDSTGGGGGGGPDTTGTDSTITPGQPLGPVSAVVMSPSTQAVHVNDSLSILATPLNAQGQVLTGRTATWAISDSTVLTTTWSMNGWILFRARKAGDVTVTATIDGVAGTARVVVQ
jgi:hypothetical protein